MNGPQPQNARVDLDLDRDYISNLPIDAKERVLMKLTIRDAVRTSVLSSKWRYTWSSIPNLVFKRDNIESRLIKLVDMVLFMHQGPILHFELETDHACNEAISRWMLCLCRNGIKSLCIRSYSNEKCKIPNSFFSCLALEDVLIDGSTIHVPPSFLGFKFLRTLELSQFKLTGITLREFISSCPLLENLELTEFVEHDCLVIRTPNLRWLHLSGEFYDLCLETPNLFFASICLEDTNSLDFSLVHKDHQSNIRRVLGSLAAIEELELSCYSFMVRDPCLHENRFHSITLEYLAMGPISGMLPAPFYKLKELRMNFDGMDKDEVAVAFCLLKSAPNLEELSLALSESESYNPSSSAQTLWEVKNTDYDLFKCLKILKVDSFESPEPILEIAKFVLSTAPVLEKLVMREKDVDDLEDGMVFVKKLMRFPRLSKKAEIVLT